MIPVERQLQTLSMFEAEQNIILPLHLPTQKYLQILHLATHSTAAYQFAQNIDGLLDDSSCAIYFKQTRDPASALEHLQMATNHVRLYHPMQLARPDIYPLLKPFHSLSQLFDMYATIYGGQEDAGNQGGRCHRNLHTDATKSVRMQTTPTKKSVLQDCRCRARDEPRTSGNVVAADDRND